MFFIFIVYRQSWRVARIRSDKWDGKVLSVLGSLGISKFSNYRLEGWQEKIEYWSDDKYQHKEGIESGNCWSVIEHHRINTWTPVYYLEVWMG